MFLVKHLSTRSDTVVDYKIAVGKSREFKSDFGAMISWIENMANGF